MSNHVLITYPLSLGVSGGGTVGCIEIARHLHALGAHVEVLSIQSEAARGGFGRGSLDWEIGSKEKDQLIRAGIQVHVTPPHPAHYSLDGIQIRKTLARIHEAEPIHLILSWHHELFGLYGYLRSSGIRTGMVTAAPSYQEFPGKSQFTRRARKSILHHCLRSSDLVFAPSRYICRSILETPGVAAEKVIHTPWGVADRFRDTSPRPDLAGTFRIMFFGWWVEAKGFFDLIEALRPLAGRDWVLEIAGWGSDKEVHRAVAHAGIENQVVILGKLDHDTLISRLERVNLAVLPSYIESFGLAVAEAQACGCPVLAYSVGAVPETVIDGETGWLVPAGNVCALTDRIGTAMADPGMALVMGMRGRERVHTHFSWRETARTILREIG